MIETAIYFTFLRIWLDYRSAGSAICLQRAEHNWCQIGSVLVISQNLTSIGKKFLFLHSDIPAVYGQDTWPNLSCGLALPQIWFMVYLVTVVTDLATTTGQTKHCARFHRQSASGMFRHVVLCANLVI